MRCNIDGVIIKKVEKYRDHRGWLVELFRVDELPPEYSPVMSYASMTGPGITRGPHEHRDQADLFCFVGPSTFRLYLWDNRLHSATYRKHCTVEAGEDNYLMVLIPAGVVHAYKNIGTVDGLVFNAPNRLYRGRGRRDEVDEIRHEDDPDTIFTIDD